MKNATIAFFGWIVVVFLVGAFVAWDFNPAHWPSEGRFIVALFGLTSGIAIAASIDKY